MCCVAVSVIVAADAVTVSVHRSLFPSGVVLLLPCSHGGCTEALQYRHRPSQSLRVLCNVLVAQ